MAKAYKIIYERQNGSINFSGDGTDIYYLFFVVHELGRLIYELEYEQSLSEGVLITLKHLNQDQAIAEIQNILKVFSLYPSPPIELTAFIEVIHIDEIYTTIELNEFKEKHSKDQLITDLYLFQLFSHLNLLRGYDLSDFNDIPEEAIPTYLN